MATFFLKFLTYGCILVKVGNCEPKYLSRKIVIVSLRAGFRIRVFWSDHDKKINSDPDPVFPWPLDPGFFFLRFGSGAVWSPLGSATQSESDGDIKIQMINNEHMSEFWIRIFLTHVDNVDPDPNIKEMRPSVSEYSGRGLIE